MTSQVRAKRRVRVIPIPSSVHREFALCVAHVRPQVMAMKLKQLVAYDAAEPNKERHCRRLEVRVSMRGRLNIRLLQDVQGVNSPAHSGVHTELDHPQQSLLMIRHQRPPSRAFPGGGAGEQLIGHGGNFGHAVHPYP
jgi:hypothetical protein